VNVAVFCSAQRLDERFEWKMENAADFVLGKRAGAFQRDMKMSGGIAAHSLPHSASSCQHHKFLRYLGQLTTTQMQGCKLWGNGFHTCTFTEGGAQSRPASRMSIRHTLRQRFRQKPKAIICCHTPKKTATCW
jgi:hypothetical protein